MKTTIDRAGRVVIPKVLREQVGLVPGKVEITVDGAALRIEVDAGVESESSGGLERVRGRLVIPAGGAQLGDSAVHEMRCAEQR